MADDKQYGELTEHQKDFTAQFYDEVNNVIGGDNPNQKLILLLPGIALTKEDFEYDYKNHAEKGPTVEANESRLANKLYDPCHICGGDNGRMLPHQYKSALDALTPKLNPEIAKSKNTLRDLLLTKYPYKFNTDTASSEKEVNTFQEVFFRLYDEYVNKLEEWSKEQSRKKDELTKEFAPSLDAASSDEERKALNTQLNNRYLQWYEDNAYSALNAVNQKMSKLLSVFSENDMKIIEGILDSGSGAELQEARATMRNLRKLTPDGGYIYPVKFNPTNWFELLDTSFKPGIDLLDSPTVIYEKLHNLMQRKRSVTSKLAAMKNLIPEDEALKAAAEELETAEAEYAKAFQAMDEAGKKALGETAETAIKLVTGICLLPTKAGAKELIESVVKPYVLGDDGLLQTMQTQGKSVADAVSQLNAELNTYTEALSKSVALNNRTQLVAARDALQAELEEIDAQIKELGTSAEYSESMNYSGEISGQATPEGFMFFYLNHKKRDTHTESKEKITVSTNGKSKGFWIFKKKNTTTTTNTDFEQLCELEDTEIEIAMNIAKIGIEREWFNPGVFVLSDDMYHLTTKPISKPFETPNYNPNDYIFPCFPVAMLLARDVTIKLNVSSVSDFNKVHTAVSEASTSKSYVFYNSGSGSKTTSKMSENTAGEECMSIIIKIPTPQIIGYYLESTPEDKSDKYNASADIDNIRTFVEAYMEVIKAKTKELEGK